LTNSDLSKIVKRKKEKIEKRIFKNQTEESSEENLTLTANEDAVKIEE
jgi:multisubunit Na+/H+ antiporter MnhE subunit